MGKADKFDIIISGGGLIGLTCANALAKICGHKPLKIALVAPDTGEPDGRTTALLAHAIDYLTQLDVWKVAAPKAAKMSVMRIIDNTRRLIHAPEVSFKSMEIGLDAFGYNILNTDLSAALETRLRENGNFCRIHDKIAGAVEDDDKVIVTLESGKEIVSPIIVGADGRNSTIRQCANGSRGIGVRQWTYPQTAIVLNFSHALPHNDTSTEFHNPSGPFTIVPLEERVSSLVWVVSPPDGEKIINTATQALNREIEDQMHSVLGKTKIISGIQCFPLSGMKAAEMASGRFVLVGEAGHVFPPIGAQGYNLGIRDVEEMAFLVEKYYNYPSKLVRIYNSNRQKDVASRTYGVDLFNRSLLSDFLPVQALRGSAIMAMGEIGPLRRLMMREGVSPGSGLRDIGLKFKKFG